MFWFAIRNTYSVQVKYRWSMFGMGEKNACSRGQGGVWLLWHVLRHYRGTSLCLGGQCFIWMKNLNAEWGNRYAVPFILESLSLNDFLPFLQKGKSLWNISLPQIHLSFHCVLEIHLQISAVAVVKKQAASSLDAMNFRGVKKVAVDSVYGTFAVYLRVQFIKCGFHGFFYSKSHPKGQAIF